MIDPTPGRVLQHTLFSRALPTPEQVSTLLARLGAVMGRDRVGAPVDVDTHRPGAFATKPFETDHEAADRSAREAGSGAVSSMASPEPSAPIVSALRRCRQPVPARVSVEDGRPVRLTTDRRGFAGGTIVRCAGPWRTSGHWWAGRAGGAGGAGEAGRAGGAGGAGEAGRAGRAGRERSPQADAAWDRDEWDVALSDGAVYRIFQNRDTEAWFIDAIVD